MFAAEDNASLRRRATIGGGRRRKACRRPGARTTHQLVRRAGWTCAAPAPASAAAC